MYDHALLALGDAPSAIRYLIDLEHIVSDVSSPSSSSKRERNPAWSRDELILALDLYLAHRASPPSKESAEVSSLSTLLNRIGALSGRATRADFRNANGVYMKMMNFRRFDPEYTAAGRIGLNRGNKDEEVVWSLFAHDNSNLRNVANGIKCAVEQSTPLVQAGATVAEDECEAVEGWILTRLHRARERNRQIVTRKKEVTVQAIGYLRCEVCQFDFGKTYGERGQGFIECHHIRPLSSLAEGSTTQLSDLALLCANCHRMIHVSQPWLTVYALRSLIEKRSHAG